ncbi:Acetoacetate-CoA ligase [Fusarium sp. Ph1]|nr:Acetoacetate-CoA ligase [Fusarium sp. Ph1]
MSLQTPRKLWEHPSPETTNMGLFKKALEGHCGESFMPGKEDDKIAVSEFNESGPQLRTTLTWGGLRQRVGQLVHAMKANGVVKGDRIATCSCNNIDTLVVFLATSAIGAIFSSSSIDMGVSGILQRLQQIKPRWVFMDDTALYNGKRIDLRKKLREVAEGLRTMLLFGTYVVLYDGSPFLPYSAALIELAAWECVTYFGTSP